MTSPIPLAENGSVGFPPTSHVEALRGGMNRLLLCANAHRRTAGEDRDLVLVRAAPRHPDVVRGLAIEDVMLEDGQRFPLVCHSLPASQSVGYSGCYREGGWSVEWWAMACAYGEDEAPQGAESMFPMMG